MARQPLVDNPYSPIYHQQKSNSVSFDGNKLGPVAKIFILGEGGVKQPPLFLAEK